MARLKQRGDEVGLREFLLERELEFRALYGERLPEAWDALSKSVNQLVGGESYSFPRYRLPGDHPMARAGAPGDYLTLTGDNRIIAN